MQYTLTEKVLITLAAVQTVKATLEASVAGFAILNAFTAELPEVRLASAVAGAFATAIGMVDVASLPAIAYVYQNTMPITRK